MKTWMHTLLWMYIATQEIQGQVSLKHCMTLSTFSLPGWATPEKVKILETEQVQQQRVRRTE